MADFDPREIRYATEDPCYSATKHSIPVPSKSDSPIETLINIQSTSLKLLHEKLALLQNKLQKVSSVPAERTEDGTVPAYEVDSQIGKTIQANNMHLADLNDMVLSMIQSLEV